MGEKNKVLIVDDSLAAHKLLKDILKEDANFAVVGIDAAIRTGDVDKILELDQIGYGLIEILESKRKTRNE